MEKTPWSESVRLCGMLTDCKTAQSLCKKAKKGRRMTQREIELLLRYADQAKDVIGSFHATFTIDQGSLDQLGLEVPKKLLLNGLEARIVKRGNWLVDESTSRCVGKLECEGSKLKLFPNPVVRPEHLARLLNVS